MLGLTIPCRSKSGHAKSGIRTCSGLRSYPLLADLLSEFSSPLLFIFYLLVILPLPLFLLRCHSWDEQINNLSMPWIWYVILASRRRLYTNLIPKNWRISFNGRNQHLWSMDTGTAYWYVEAKKPRKIGTDTDTDMPNIRSWKNCLITFQNHVYCYMLVHERR